MTVRDEWTGVGKEGWSAWERFVYMCWSDVLSFVYFRGAVSFLGVLESLMTAIERCHLIVSLGIIHSACTHPQH
jgi:hypothetical protein